MLNVRLPEDLEARLSQEATRSEKSRSAVVREAITFYLANCERRRFMQSMGRAAEAIGEDAAAAQDSRRIAEDFLSLENELSEIPGDYDTGDGWWK